VSEVHNHAQARFDCVQHTFEGGACETLLQVFLFEWAAESSIVGIW